MLTFSILNESNIWAKVYRIWKIVRKTAVNSTIQFLKPQSKEISGKSFKFFGPPTTIWRPWKIFAKLYGNHLLIANIFKLHKCQVFVLFKMHNTVFSAISRHRWCRKYCPLIGGVRLLENFSISVLISRIKHFSISLRCSCVD